MRAGKLDRLVVVQTKVPGRTALGDTTETWTTAHKIMCELFTTAAIERVVGTQESNEVNFGFVTRRWPLATVDPKEQRLFYEGRPQELHGVVDLGRGKGVLITTTGRAQPGTPGQAAPNVPDPEPWA